MSIQFPNLGINLDYVGNPFKYLDLRLLFFWPCNSSGNAFWEWDFVILEAKRCGENKDDYLEMMIISLLRGGGRIQNALCFMFLESL